MNIPNNFSFNNITSSAYRPIEGALFLRVYNNTSFSFKKTY